MEDFYGKKFWKIEKKNFRIFFLFLIFSKFLCSKNFRIQIFFLSEIFYRMGRCRRPKRGRSPLKSERSELSAAGLAPAAEGGVSPSDTKKDLMLQLFIT